MHSDMFRRTPTYHMTSQIMNGAGIFSKSTIHYMIIPTSSGFISDTHYLIRQPSRILFSPPDLIRHKLIIFVADTHHVTLIRIVADTILVAALLWLILQLRSALDFN